MARNTAIITVAEAGRDYGKNFLLTEMPPRQGEKWAMRALNAIAKAGRNEMPDDFAAAGMAGLAAIGLRALTTMDFSDAEPLFDEMMTCVSFIPDMTKVDQTTAKPYAVPLIDAHIEEVGTILKLRSDIIELHTGFSVAAYLSMLGRAMKAAGDTTDTPTSPPASEPS